METSTGEVTRLLQDWSDGRREALDQLLPLVYDELRRLAHRVFHLWHRTVRLERTFEIRDNSRLEIQNAEAHLFW